MGTDAFGVSHSWKIYFDSKGKVRASLAKASPFKGRVEREKVPGTVDSRWISGDEGCSFEGDAVVSSKLMDDSDEERGWVDDDEVGSGGESLVMVLPCSPCHKVG